jgi:fructokinase
MHDALRMADLVKVSGDEVEFLTGTCELDEACRRLREYGPRLAAVTLGSEGCYYSTPSAAGYLPGVPVQAVDTLGAGDAFLAGLLAGLLNAADGSPVLNDHAPPLGALRFANVVGAITTTRYGAIPALPTREEVDALLAAQAT